MTNLHQIMRETERLGFRYTSMHRRNEDTGHYELRVAVTSQWVRVDSTAMRNMVLHWSARNAVHQLRDALDKCRAGRLRRFLWRLRARVLTLNLGRAILAIPIDAEGALDCLGRVRTLIDDADRTNAPPPPSPPTVDMRQ